jgi:uncharacterized Zn finger protein
MRRLIHCPTCSPSDKTTRNIWDLSSLDRTRTCRCCRTVVVLKALPAAVVAKRAAHSAAMEALLAELLAA